MEKGRVYRQGAKYELRDSAGNSIMVIDHIEMFAQTIELISGYSVNGVDTIIRKRIKLDWPFREWLKEVGELSVLKDQLSEQVEKIERAGAAKYNEPQVGRAHRQRVSKHLSNVHQSQLCQMRGNVRLLEGKLLNVKY